MPGYHKNQLCPQLDQSFPFLGLIRVDSAIGFDFDIGEYEAVVRKHHVGISFGIDRDFLILPAQFQSHMLYYEIMDQFFILHILSPHGALSLINIFFTKSTLMTFFSLSSAGLRAAPFLLIGLVPSPATEAAFSSRA